MNAQEKERLKNTLALFLNESLEKILLSHPTDSNAVSRSRLRPLLIKGVLRFQAEEQVGKQAFHRNMDREETVDYVIGMLDGSFRQGEILSDLGRAVVLVSKKGKVTVKVKEGKHQVQRKAVSHRMEHNRKKHYILEEGVAVPFLVDLGVMTREGRIVHSQYDKYRQINRFLEFIEDILPNLSQEKESRILDFGCGKSYLTFAMYYYLKVMKKYPLHIVGLDLKQEVIERCNHLSRQYGYDTLQFVHGDIASYEGFDQVDMVVTLHACDTATDFALAKAVSWGARVILSVPCCQHELNGQIENQLMKPVFQYGLIRERMAALYTDAIRAQVLEGMGYRTQILEFVEMEHTPKNLLIRAVFQGKKKDNVAEIRELTAFLNARPTILELLDGERNE